MIFLVFLHTFKKKKKIFLSHLRSKSEFNLDAAQILIDVHSYYAPSVHCSYFGCFQHIKYKLNRIGITYEKIDGDIAASRHSNATTLNSHKYPIKLILDKIEEKAGGSYRKKVSDKINLLKTARVISDYHNEDVGPTEGNAALKLSKEIIKLINDKI